MKMRSVLLLVLVLLWNSPAATEVPENLAAGVSYSLYPSPQYAYSTDSGDATQLTDGQYVEGHFWTQPGTVGWTNAKPIVITLDLGADRPIRGMSFNTAAGAADVAWPSSIGVYVAVEDGAYHRLGDLVSLGAVNGLPPAEGYAVHRYWTDALETHGRFVSFVVLNVPYAFVDEIEILGGDAAWLSRQLPGNTVKDVAQDAAQLQGEASIRRRLSWDLRELREAVQASLIDAGEKSRLLDEAARLEQEVAVSVPAYGADFRAILPLNPLHAEIFQFQAALWRAQGQAPLVAWPADTWGFLRLSEAPRGDDAGVEIHAMKNEYRSAAFNISNSGKRPAQLQLSLEGLPGGSNPPYVRVREVLWTDTNSGMPVAAALLDAEKSGGGYAVEIPAGMTRQIWLTVHPTDVPSGMHRGTAKLSGADFAAEVPIALRVYPMVFPPLPRIHFGGWDYTHGGPYYQAKDSNRAALIALLSEYFVDSPWASAEVMPFGAYDSEGNMTEEPDTAAFETWLERWPNARKYCVFLAVTESTLPFPGGSKAFNRAVKQWSAFWARQARVLHMTLPHNFSLLLLDEPSSPAHQAVIVDWARALKSSATGFNVWEDPVFATPEAANLEMLELCDVLCPNRPLFLSATPQYRELFTARRTGQKRLEFYSCSGPVRLLDPYSYHRLQAWDCWRFGATGSYFWAFGDSGGSSSWNEYAAKGAAFTPLFLDDAGATAGKHLEACREGLEDYETLAMLQDAVHEAKSSGKNAAWTAKAEQFLETRPAMAAEQGYLPSFQWKEALDRHLADAVRIEALALLEEAAAGPAP